jgi:hypothetical protein
MRRSPTISKPALYAPAVWRALSAVAGEQQKAQITIGYVMWVRATIFQLPPTLEDISEDLELASCD